MINTKGLVAQANLKSDENGHAWKVALEKEAEKFTKLKRKMPEQHQQTVLSC